MCRTFNIQFLNIGSFGNFLAVLRHFEQRKHWRYSKQSSSGDKMTLVVKVDSGYIFSILLVFRRALVQFASTFDLLCSYT